MNFWEFKLYLTLPITPKKVSHPHGSGSKRHWARRLACGFLQGWFLPPKVGSPDRAGRGFACAILIHPTPRSLFTCNFVCVDATPEKCVLPASGDTDNQHRWPTHAAGRLQASPGASLPDGVAVRGACPRRRRAPCLGGSCRRVETPPYKVVLGVQLLILCAILSHQCCVRLV